MSSDNLSILSSELAREKLKSVLQSKLRSDDIEILFEEGSQNKDNYSGIVHRVTAINNKPTELNDLKELKIIVKIAPTNDERRAMFYSRPLFLQEMFVYNEVSCHIAIFCIKFLIKNYYRF